MNDKDRKEIVKLIQDEITTRERYKLTLEQFEKMQRKQMSNYSAAKVVNAIAVGCWYIFAAFAFYTAFGIAGVLSWFISTIGMWIVVAA